MIGLPLELRLCFEPCVQCAGQFIGLKFRFDDVIYILIWMECRNYSLLFICLSCSRVRILTCESG